MPDITLLIVGQEISHLLLLRRRFDTFCASSILVALVTLVELFRCRACTPRDATRLSFQCTRIDRIGTRGTLSSIIHQDRLDRFFFTNWTGHLTIAANKSEIAILMPWHLDLFHRIHILPDFTSLAGTVLFTVTAGPCFGAFRLNFALFDLFLPLNIKRDTGWTQPRRQRRQCCFVLFVLVNQLNGMKSMCNVHRLRGHGQIYILFVRVRLFNELNITENALVIDHIIGNFVWTMIAIMGTELAARSALVVNRPSIRKTRLIRGAKNVFGDNNRRVRIGRCFALVRCNQLRGIIIRQFRTTFGMDTKGVPSERGLDQLLFLVERVLIHEKMKSF